MSPGPLEETHIRTSSLAILSLHPGQAERPVLAFYTTSCKTRQTNTSEGGSVHGAQFLSLLLFCFRGDTQHTITTTKATGTQRIIKSMGKTYFKGIFRHRQKGFVKKNAKLATDNVVVGNDDEFRSLQSCIRACIMDACIIMGERFNGLR
jgi:hypothetical protein